jgi:choline dehydrogenase-like flavoprotein
MNTCHVNFQLNGRHLIVEDCAIPAMAAPLAAVALRLLDNPLKRELFKGALRLAWMTKVVPDLSGFVALIPDTGNPAAYSTEAEAVADVFFFNAMGQDEANGRFSLDGDELDLNWDTPVTEQPVFGQLESLLIELSSAMASSDPSSGYVPFPLWRGLGVRKLDVTHPLGGCRIGADSSSGVVDEYGRVYDGAQPTGSTEVHPGLFLVDASVIPGAVVAHPTLTIMAQALKTMTAAV